MVIATGWDGLKDTLGAFLSALKWTKVADALAAQIHSGNFAGMAIMHHSFAPHYGGNNRGYDH